ncbi:NUDIX domain-containing protein [bacterium]|nr:NUDIX domain-containing protein [bacterium]
MDKFSKVQKVQQGPKVQNQDEYVFSGEYIKVKNINGYECTEMKDSIFVLPYIKDEGMILMRYEQVPSFQHRYKDTNWRNKTHYITLIGGGIEEGESPTIALKRELYEEAGVVLSDLYQLDIKGPFFMAKSTINQIYFCLMEINYNDYRFTLPPTDGSQIEKNSKTIKISLGDIDEIVVSDLITQYMLCELKKEYNIK